MSFEKLWNPLMIAGAIAGIYALMRKPVIVSQMTVAGNGIDPGRWLGETAADFQQYLAEVPSYAMDPAYIYHVARDRFSRRPLPGNIPGPSPVPSYLTYNTQGGNNPYTYLEEQMASHSGCGCGGSCGDSGGCPKPKCKPVCNSGVQFSGSGSCLQAETGIVPTMWMG